MGIRLAHRIITKQNLFFHPLIVLGVSLVTALLFALLVIACFEGDARLYLLGYFMPIGIPFVACIFDRVEGWRSFRPVQRAVDLFVLALSLVRIAISVPLVSGHALFLTHALLSSRSLVVRGTAAAVLLEVGYLKIFLFHDDITLVGGVILGCITALVFRLAQGQKPADDAQTGPLKSGNQERGKNLGR
jgi:hypothetical protein